ncbi:hypothetical protein [Pigmentiphaga sp.]|uniref:hypothetical protein n=1 Tax=Pigmentiphaga sp. TaxID=1977564 RepID=UPI00128C4C9D|nr:hypothetical protein [Pigmentiphaga sp.]MPS25942.1 hypothetical protein [Alcaligenaceae bacterium SAGV5]MPS52939.1 hypothetical protein [Alcaligenaceae bacterium SAGV3]MPT59843.1 hypothetical protein [Alcaligenaceae bacterium]
MKRIVFLGAGCVLVGLNAGAQPAPPQTRTPWVDSTHITGVAARVMPDRPVAPPPDAPSEPRAPATIQELLDRMAGAELYFREVWEGRSGSNELPSMIRVVVGSPGAEVQVHNVRQDNWYRLCVLTPWTTRCEVGEGFLGATLVLDITHYGIRVSGAYCSPGYYGAVWAWAQYTWESYSAGHGAFSNQNRHLQPVNNGYSGYFFQNGGFQSSCYHEMPG